MYNYSGFLGWYEEVSDRDLWPENYVAEDTVEYEAGDWSYDFD